MIRRRCPNCGSRAINALWLSSSLPWKNPVCRQCGEVVETKPLFRMVVLWIEFLIMLFGALAALNTFGFIGFAAALVLFIVVDFAVVMILPLRVK